MMKAFGRAVLQGLFLLLPLLISVELLRWVFNSVENWLRPLWLMVLPSSWYFPGLAVISFVLVAALIGVTARIRWVEALWQLPERVIDGLPVIRSVYTSMKELFAMFSGDKFSDKPVVEVTLPGIEGKLVGIVTARPGDGFAGGELLKPGEILVYFPMSYMIGGYMVAIPESSVRVLPILPMDAMQMVMTGGLIKAEGARRSKVPPR